MPDRGSGIESIGSLVGGMITWGLVAAVLGVVMTSGVTWGLWALGVWIALLLIDFIQAQLRNRPMYVRVLSELWHLPL